MLRIRLARTGRKKLAHYRVVVSESHRTPTGGAATQIGYFDPHTEELSVDTDTLQHYLDKGAQPSGRIVRLLQDRDDITLPEQAKQNLVVKEEKIAEPEEEQTSEQTGQEAESQDGTQASGTEEDPGDSASGEDSGKEADSDEPEAPKTADEEEGASEDTEDTTGASETEKTS